MKTLPVAPRIGSKSLIFYIKALLGLLPTLLPWAPGSSCPAVACCPAAPGHAIWLQSLAPACQTCPSCNSKSYFSLDSGLPRLNCCDRTYHSSMRCETLTLKSALPLPPTSIAVVCADAEGGGVHFLMNPCVSLGWCKSNCTLKG